MSFKRNTWVTPLALAIGLVLLCNDTNNRGSKVDAQEFGRSAGASYREVEFMPSAESGAYFDSDQPIVRLKRQISIPEGSPYQQQQQQPQQLQQPQQQQQPGGGGGIMSYLAQLGPQIERARALTTLLSPQPQQQPQQQPSIFGMGGVGSGSPTSSVDPMQLMTQLSNLISATRDRNTREAQSGQAIGQAAVDSANQQGQAAVKAANQQAQAGVDTAQSFVQAAGQQAQDLNKSSQNGFMSMFQTAGQQTSEAAKNAQSGITSALTEIGAGLQRIANNNPSLLPDVKNLYQSVSSKLSSASSSVGQVAAQPNAQSNPLPSPISS